MTIDIGGLEPANDDTHARYRGGYPALKWLLKRDPQAARVAMAEIGDSTFQTRGNGTASYLNPREATADDREGYSVPDKPVSADTLAEQLQDGPDRFLPETLHEIRPTEREVFMALGWIEWPVTGRSASIGWAMRCRCGMIAPCEGRHLQPTFSKDERATLAGMLFSFHPDIYRPAGGTMLSYTDRRGTVRLPVYIASKLRGGKRPQRTKAALTAYLKLKPTTPSPLHTTGHRLPMSSQPVIPPMYSPLLREPPSDRDEHGRYGVEEARALLRAFGVDNSVPFDALPFPATRCPTTIAKSARFIAGIVGRKLTASVPAPSWQARDPKPLTPALEEAASRGTLANIGLALGDVTTRPDRLGKRTLLAEARALVAANENISQKQAA